MLDTPLIILAPAIILSLVAIALIGLLLVRRFILPRLRVSVADSEFSGAVVQSIMVFYGLALALISVNVWQTYNDVGKTISLEATTFYTLYRDVSGYPEPTRSKLQGEIRGYIKQVIDEAFPLMHKGQMPTAGVEWMTRFSDRVILLHQKDFPADAPQPLDLYQGIVSPTESIDMAVFEERKNTLCFTEIGTGVLPV